MKPSKKHAGNEYWWEIKKMKGGWRWRIWAPNGRLIGGSAGDGYKRRADCVKMLNLIRERGYSWLVEG